MVELLEKAFAEVSKLPAEQQEIFAQWILDELDDETRWVEPLPILYHNLKSWVKKHQPITTLERQKILSNVDIYPTLLT